MTSDEQAHPTWLTTTEAADHLGVHPSTLRRWADDGMITAMVTPGGHRRFALADLEAFRRQGQQPTMLPADESVWAQQALSHTRAQIVEHQSTSMMRAFDEGERRRSRQLGRRLLGLILRYVSMREGGEDVLAEVSQVGHAYAAAARSAGLPLQQALEIAMFFRDGLVETTLEFPEKASVQTGANVQLLRRLNPVMNTLQLAVVDAYEEEATENG
jgi:excisionase family DNA binding protein